MDSKTEKIAFTLILLGTLTEFTDDLKQIAKSGPYTKGAKVNDYPKGETLSIIASLIKVIKAVKTTKLDLKTPYPYQADEVTVINGPQTDAANVGEKIGLGLAAILKAVGRGQTNINLLGHSRGAVEAILIAHELEAMQKIIAECNNFEEIFKHLSEQQSKRKQKRHKPYNNTPDIIQPLKAQINLLAKEEQELLFSSLKTSLPLTTINYFGIDPVPGDCFPITWYDGRYFTLPEIIKNTEILYYANERSDWGFTPIFPEVVSKEKQNFVRYSMPGNHGTGSSGNDGSQQRIIVSPDGTKTTHVQKLILIKLIYFLSQQGVEFNDSKQIYHQYSALGRKYLGISDQLDTVDFTTLDYPTIFRTLYETIAKNQAAYDAYNLTNYSYMGLSNQRKALNEGHTYGLCDEKFPPYDGRVNEEHASLMQAHFFKIFNLDTKHLSSVEIINTACGVLEENIVSLANQEESLLDKEETRQTVLDTFGIVIQEVSQHYLTKDWSSPKQQEEKEALYQGMNAILTKFKELSASNNEVIQAFVKNLHLLCFVNINNIIKIRAQNLEKEFNSLEEPTDKRLIHFFSGLLIQLKYNEDPSLILNEIINSEEYKLLPNHPSSIKISHIHKKLTGKGLEKYTSKQLSNSYEEQFATTIEDFEKLYNQVHTLILDLGTLRSLELKGKLEIEELKLLELTDGLIAIAAERFYKERPLDPPPVAHRASFISLAEQYAIKHLKILDRKTLKTETTSYFSYARFFFTRSSYSSTVTPEASAPTLAPTPSHSNENG